MENILKNKETQVVENAMNTIINEHIKLIHTLKYEEIAALIPVINNADRLFVMGAGRTGLMMKAAAMRLMHLGYTVHVVGETTAPAIMKGDLLIAGSGSGNTSGIVSAAETAKKVGAAVLCFTTNKESPLAQLANQTVTIPAAQKQERVEAVSKQYAGSLFEQSLLLVFDALIQSLWEIEGTSTSELWKRHANME
ncbi:3-hexulose-6-phosphate isomerase [Cellulophaga algicola DSM 14237]|uniref:3-hexulose-6-phosphate isomerase n=1 Tax=Cellulophaga algicola (strain DSM 14237 / IC166 / ACAM 630) TaxID=688270 RepID=E6XCZ5_CELAD|nr:6-phospho-3-hexuloisomerase [Cellulophaga algicola]ADV51182.1 3-hexulose-6-phosphate isomerase [Cellulophaga algicola DSM 14237]